MFNLENFNVPLMSDEGIEKIMKLYSEVYNKGKYHLDGYITNLVTLSTDRNSTNNDLKEFYRYQKDACIKEIVCLIKAIEEDISTLGIEEFIQRKKQQTNSPELLNCLNTRDIYSAIHYPKDMMIKHIQNDEINMLPKLVQFLYNGNKSFDEKHAGRNDLPFVIGKEVFDNEHIEQGRKHVRIYLNNPLGKEGLEFYTLFLKCLIENRIPYSNKYNYNKVVGRRDKSIFYFPVEYLNEVIAILDNIQKERPDMISKFGTPPSACGQYSYYGISHIGAGVAINTKQRTYNMFVNDVTSIAYFIYFCKQLLMHGAIISKMSDAEKYIVKNYAQGVRNNLVCMEIVNQVNFNNSGIIALIKKYGNLFSVSSQINDYRYILKQVVSMRMYGDLDHMDYPICFNEYFYDTSLSTIKKL